MTTFNIRYGRALDGSLVFIAGDDNVYCTVCGEHIEPGDYYTHAGRRGKSGGSRCRACYGFELSNVPAMAVVGRYDGDSVWARLDAETLELSDKIYQQFGRAG